MRRRPSGFRWARLGRSQPRRVLPSRCGRRETKKRQPPVPLPDQLLAHLRRWKRRGQEFAVEWNGSPVQSVDKAFANVVIDAGLGNDVRHMFYVTPLRPGSCRRAPMYGRPLAISG